MNKKSRKSLYRYASIAASLVMVLCIATSMNAGIAHATGDVFATASNDTGIVQTPIATNLQITGTGNSSLELNLYVPYGSLNFGTTTGLTFVGSSTGATIKVDGLRSDLNTALSTLTYTASTTGTVTVEAWLGSGNFAYDRENQHVYQIVSATSTWSQAEALAASSTFDGVQGYLATITTQDEDNFVVARIFQDGWIGATDDPTEGQWHWATGPEAGLQFWSGSATGTPVAGQFSNWFMGEPNNQYSISNPSDTMSSSSPYGENCAEIRIVEDNGQWNDVACNSPLPNYVVEYGAPGNLPNVAASSFTVTVNLPASVVGLQTIQSYASSMGTTTAPTVQNYTDAGVTGVNSSNLAAMNLALAGGGTIANLAAAQQLVTQELPIIASANAAAAAAAAAAANTQVQSFHGVGGQMAFPTISTGQVQSNESVTAPSISNVSTSVQVPQVPSIVSAASASTPVPTRDLQLGMNGNDVVMLQQFLNGNGYTIAASGAGSSGNETIYFGSLTKSALAKWQKAHGVSPASGYFGSITRAKMKSLGVSGLWW